MEFTPDKKYRFTKSNPLYLDGSLEIHQPVSAPGIQAAAPTTTRPTPPSKGKPATFEAAVDQFIKAGHSRSEAIRLSVEQFADLHRAYIAQANRGRK